jgi:AcrR family transcriptional regulator
MQKQPGSESMRSILDPTVPADIGVQSQRQRIIDAMIESCAEKTYAATTISDIVGRASISRTTFYKRFPDKRQCFDAALDHCVEKVQAAAAVAHSPADAPPEAVRKATEAVLELLAAQPALAQLVMGEAVTVDPAVIDRYRRLLIPAVEDLWTAVGQPVTPHSAPRLAFGRVQVLIFNQIATGRTTEMLEILPEIVYLALLPFAGHDEAVKQARLVEGDAASNDSARCGDG